MMSEQHLHALAVTASSYGSGLHVTFYESLQRHRAVDTLAAHRRAWPASALRTCSRRRRFRSCFPRWRCHARRTPSTAATARCGSRRRSRRRCTWARERILVVGAGRMHEPPGRARRQRATTRASRRSPAMRSSSIFLDALAVDVERLQRINQTLSLLTPEAARRDEPAADRRAGDRAEPAARRHGRAAPGQPAGADTRDAARRRRVGRGRRRAWRGAGSYLLFESAYTRALIALGVADTLARRDEVIRFFGWDRQPSAELPMVA